MRQYEELQLIILGVALLIVAILSLTHRNSRPLSGKSEAAIPISL